MRRDITDRKRGTSLDNTVMYVRQTLIGDAVVIMPGPSYPPGSDLCENPHATCTQLSLTL